MEASPRKKKRNAKDAKKSAKQRAEKTNSIDEELSLIKLQLTGIALLSGILDILLISWKAWCEFTS